MPAGYKRKRLLLALLSVVAAVAGAEVIARFTLGPTPRGNITPVPAAIRGSGNVPGVRYTLRAGAEVKHVFPSNPRGYFDSDDTLTYRINSLGFRGPETTRRRPDGVFRILGLGDSFTFGTGVRQEHTFLAVLERSLTEGGADREFEVLNMGVMGYDTVDEVALLRHTGIGLSPQLVVICFFLNDAQGGAAHAAFNVDSGRGGLGRFSVIADRIQWMADRRRQTASLVDSYRASFTPDAPGWRRGREALAEASEVLSSRDIHLVLVVFPVLWQLSDGYPFHEIHQIVGSFASANRIPVLDLLAAFAGNQGPELWVHPTNQHPNEIAHEIAGRALYRFLMQNGLLD